jgi:hypothetical protein
MQPAQFTEAVVTDGDAFVFGAGAGVVEAVGRVLVLLPSSMFQ